MALQLRTSCPHCMSLLSHADCDCAKRGVVGVARDNSVVDVTREAWWAWQERSVWWVWQRGMVGVARV